MLFAFDASVKASADVTATVTHRAPEIQAALQQLRGDIHELTAAVSANAAQAVWLDGAKTGAMVVGAVALALSIIVVAILVRSKTK